MPERYTDDLTNHLALQAGSSRRGIPTQAVSRRSGKCRGAIQDNRTVKAGSPLARNDLYRLARTAKTSCACLAVLAFGSSQTNFPSLNRQVCGAANAFPISGTPQAKITRRYQEAPSRVRA